MSDELSKTQAADVLRRAAQLQARSESSQGMGLSLEELKHAAEAAGIDGRYVEQAYFGAGEDVPASEPFMGIETGVQRVRVVPGHVSDDEWGQMVLALRREYGTDGLAETLGGVREWKAHQTRVQLERDGPRTRITASSTWRGDATVPLYASVVYTLSSTAFAVAGLLNGEQAMWGISTMLVVVAVLHAAFALGPVRMRARKRAPQLDRVVDTLERLAGVDEREAGVASKTAEPSAARAAANAARLDPIAPDAPESELAAQRDSTSQRLRA